MQQKQSPLRKVYSHTNKVMMLPSILRTNDILQRSSKDEPRNKGMTSRQKLQKNLKKLQRESKYQVMIDEVIKKHVEEEKIPVFISKISNKQSYKNFRIVGQEEADSVHSNERLKPFHKRESWQISINPTTEDSSDRKDKSIEKKQQVIELPLVFKYKKSTSTEGREEALSTRQSRMNELKVNTILKYIRSSTEVF